MAQAMFLKSVSEAAAREAESSSVMPTTAPVEETKMDLESQENDEDENDWLEDDEDEVEDDMGSVPASGAVSQEFSGGQDAGEDGDDDTDDEEEGKLPTAVRRNAAPRAPRVIFQKIYRQADAICGLFQSTAPLQEDMSEYDAAAAAKQAEGPLATAAQTDFERLREHKRYVQVITPTATDMSNTVVNSSSVSNSAALSSNPTIAAVAAASAAAAALSVKHHEENSMKGAIGLWKEDLQLARVQAEEMVRNCSDVAAKQAVIDWEDEVRALYTSTEDGTNDSVQSSANAPLSSFHVTANGQLNEYTRTLPTELAPYHVFDPDYIDIDSRVDPLEELIPNDFSRFDRQALAEVAAAAAKSEIGSMTMPEEQNTNLTGRQLLRWKLFERFVKDTGDPIDSQLAGDAYLKKVENNKRRLLDKANRIRSVNTWVDASSSVMRNAMKRTRDATLHKQTGAVIASLNHAAVARTHRNTRTDMSEMELKYFHRPRMIKERTRHWKISLRPSSMRTTHNPSAGSGDTPSTTGTGASTIAPGTTKSDREIGNKLIMSEAEKQNLSLSNNRSKFIIVEYIEEFPPVVLNFGMASVLLNYYRMMREANDQDANEVTLSSIGGNLVRRPKKAEPLSSAALQSIRTTLQENNCRLPRHVMMLWELQNTRRPYEHDAYVPKLPLGQTKVLQPDEKSPFLGTLEEDETQPSLVNNLFRAPLFPHNVPPTDFLLVRTRLSSTEMSYVLRTIPHLFLAGQMEPRKIVPRPSSQLLPTQEALFKLVLVRLLATLDKCPYMDIMSYVLRYHGNQHKTPQKSDVRRGVVDLLESIGTEDNHGYWHLKSYIADEAAQQIDTLVRSFGPEDVALWESSMAGEYRLGQQYVPDVDLPKLQAYLNYLHQRKQYQKTRVEAVKGVIESQYSVWHTSTNPAKKHAVEQADHFVKLLITEIHRLDVKLSIARYILERVVMAPWNTTAAFVNSVISQDNQGKMDINGLGDPSGRGEAFAFVRIPRNNQLATSGRRAAPSKLVGTEKDLRKLHANDAIELLMALGVKRTEALALKRWDRIHMLREMVDKLEKSGVSHTLSRYVRDPALMERGKNKGLSEEEFKKVSQEIWVRQKLALQSSQDPLDSTNTLSKEAMKRERKLKKMQNQLLQGSASASKLVITGGSSAAATGTETGGDSTGVTSTVTAAEGAMSPAIEASPIHTGVEETPAPGAESDSDDSDLAEDIERTLAQRSMNKSGSTTYSSTTRGPSGPGGSAIDLSAGANVNTSSTSGVSHGADKEALTSFTEVFSGDGNRRPGGSNATGTGVRGEDQSRQYVIPGTEMSPEVALQNESWPRPPKVVRRLIRTITADGKEAIRIEFIIDPAEIRRVEKANREAREQRDRNRVSTAMASLREESPDDSRNVAVSSLAPSSTTLQVGKLKKTVSAHQSTKKRGRRPNASANDDEYDGISPPIRLSGRSGRGEEEEEDIDESEYRPSKKSSKRSGAVIHPRIPIISLAQRFERELQNLWSIPGADVFHYPVDENIFHSYRTVVPDPICLRDIRDKNLSFGYFHSDELLLDLQRMADNSERFNGPQHHITLLGRNLHKMMHDNLMHERAIFGIDKDPLSLMEAAVAQKHPSRT